MIQQFSGFSSNSDIRHWHIPSCTAFSPLSCAVLEELELTTELAWRKKRSIGLNLNQYHDSTPCEAAHTACQNNSCWHYTSWARNAAHWGHSITKIKYWFMVKCCYFSGIVYTANTILNFSVSPLLSDVVQTCLECPQRSELTVMAQMNTGSPPKSFWNANLLLN